MDWIPNLINWLLTATNVLAFIFTIAGAITVIGTLVIYLVKVIRYFIVDPFGSRPPAPVGPRYQKFFLSLRNKVKRKRDKVLIPPPAIGMGNSCVFITTSPNIAYCVHFTAYGIFRVYLNMTGADGDRLFNALQQQQAGFKKWFKEPLVWEYPEGALGYRIIVNYPGGGVIGDDARKLRRMRKWAIARLITFRKVFDPRVQAIRAGIAPLQAIKR